VRTVRWLANQPVGQGVRCAGISLLARTQGDAVLRARIKHKSNSVLGWCIGNLVGHYDTRGNAYPGKTRPEQKIDAAITAILGSGRVLASQPFRSRYEDPSEKMPFI
jgi:phage terminase large subunit-like protein